MRKKLNKQELSELVNRIGIDAVLVGDAAMARYIPNREVSRVEVMPVSLSDAVARLDAIGERWSHTGDGIELLDAPVSVLDPNEGNRALRRAAIASARDGAVSPEILAIMKLSDGSAAGANDGLAVLMSGACDRERFSFLLDTLAFSLGTDLSGYVDLIP